MKMPPLSLRIFGYYRVKTEIKFLTRLQNLFFSAGIVAYSDGEDGFYIKTCDKQTVLTLAKRERLPLSVSPLLGLSHRLHDNRYRIGLPIGIVLAVIILLFGTNTVWRMEITGNENISSGEIEEGLSCLGFGVGSKTNRDNYDYIITAYRLEHPKIAWMGIYTKGTTAYVRIIENEFQSAESGEKLASNLVATDDAIVLHLDIAHGTSVVKSGSVVKKGDALVLGIVPGAHYDAVLAAEGTVVGRVSKEFVVETPYLQVEKTEKNRKKLGMSLFFFENTINIFKKTSKTPLDYVIIERKEVFRVGKYTLPFGFYVKEAVYYDSTERTLSKEEALLEGQALLEQKIRDAVGDGELFLRRVRVDETDDAFLLHATIEYTKNIAVQQPFTVG